MISFCEIYNGIWVGISQMDYNSYSLSYSSFDFVFDLIVNWFELLL